MSHVSLSEDRLRKPGVASLPGQTSTSPRETQGISPGLGYLIERLGVCEFRRRILHMMPGLLPAFLWFIPHLDPWGVPLIAAAIILAVSVTLLAIFHERDFARANENHWYQAVLGYSIPVMGLLLLLPGRSELGLMTLGIVAFGDGSAALGGTLFGKRRLPWNRHKTWAGLCCFVCVGTVAATFNYWTEARPVVPFGTVVSIATVATLAAGLTESLPFRSHDNLRVGMTAAATALLMQTLLLGW